MILRPAFCIVAALLTLWLGGCADTASTSGAAPRPFTDMVRGYDQTLTKTERTAVITELKNDKVRQQEQIGADEAATGSTPPQNTTGRGANPPKNQQ